MKILLVHSGNAVGGDSSKYTFVREQGEELRKLGCEIAYYAVVGKGMRGYLRNVKPLRKKIQEFQPDIVHAHYGLCGMVAVLAAKKKVPVVVTCHNGETLTKYGNIISSLAIHRADYTICVAQHIYDKLYLKPKPYMIQPCGIDLKDLPLVDKAIAQKEMNLSPDKINILFGGSFSNARKNAPLANAAIALLKRDDVNLIEMKGFNRQQVEAMACNCPIVATDVADIAYLLQGVTNSYVTSFDPADVAEKIQRVIDSGERTNGRERINELKLDNPLVCVTILGIYKEVLKK